MCHRTINYIFIWLAGKRKKNGKTIKKKFGREKCTKPEMKQ